MSEVRAAGWYPDPHDDSSECWWGGTDWTASTRPLNHPPAQATPPPLPVAIALPPPGWYPDPQNAAGEKWFDGAGWTQVTRQRAVQSPPGGDGLPGMPAAALLVDGLVGRPSPHGNRGGVFSSLHGIAFGLILMALSFIVPSGTIAPANMSATATGTVARIQISQGSPPASGSTPNAVTCVPVAEFGVGGKTYSTASGPVGFLPCPWRVGQQVPVAYDPASPASAMVPNQEWARYLPWILAGLGALMTVGSLISFVRSVAALSAGGSLLMRMWRRRKP